MEKLIGVCNHLEPNTVFILLYIPASILYKSIAGRYRLVSYSDVPITACYIFIKNVYWDITVVLVKQKTLCPLYHGVMFKSGWRRIFTYFVIVVSFASSALSVRYS